MRSLGQADRIISAIWNVFSLNVQGNIFYIYLFLSNRLLFSEWNMTICPQEEERTKRICLSTFGPPISTSYTSIICEPASAPMRATSTQILRLPSASQRLHAIDVFAFSSSLFAVITGTLTTPFLLKCYLHYMLGHLSPDLQSILQVCPAQSLLPFSLCSQSLVVETLGMNKVMQRE